MRDGEKLKAHVIQMCCEGQMTVREGAMRLKLSERQVKKLKARIKEFGVESILHRNCGRQPKHTLSSETQQKILEIKELPEYANVNFYHFCEELRDEFGIKVSYSALRNLLIANGIKSPKTRRKRKVKHQRRKRRERFGELLQTDATPYDWYGIGGKSALHALIDDATGKLTGLYMCKNECYEGYAQITRQTLKRHGIPLAIYADGLSIFFSNEKLSVEDELAGKMHKLTQYGEILSGLGTQLIHARSPEAKGRVERLWETLQSRLPVEFAKRGIKTDGEANAFLVEYMEIFNTRFGVLPSKEESAFMKSPKGINLDTLLAWKATRIVDNSGCFSFDGVICKCNIKDILPRTKVEILVSVKLGVKVRYLGHLYNPTPILDTKNRHISGSSIQTIFARFVQNNCLKNQKTAA